MQTVLALGMWGASFGLVACGGDHYGGGGRRDEVPTQESSPDPSVGPGDGTSAQGGSSGASGDAGAAGTGAADG